MPRILGVDIPQNKKVPYALVHLYGIGLHRARIVCTECAIDENRRAHQLTEEELGRIASFIESNKGVFNDAINKVVEAAKS